MLADIEPAVPQRDQAVSGRRVVAPDVAPARVAGMRSPAVKLDHHQVRLVEHVPVLAPATPSHPDLPGHPRQAVPTLHVVQVAVLKPGQCSGHIGGQRPEHLGAPAQPGPPSDCCLQPGRRAEPAAKRPGQPAVRDLEARCAVDQVEHRLLDLGLRRAGHRVHGLRGTHRHMHDDARNLGDPAVRRDGDVHRVVAWLTDPGPLCRGLMAQHRARSGPEQRRPERAFPVQRAGEGRVDTAVNPLPAASFDMFLDDGAAEARGTCLAAGQDARLELGELLKLRG